MFFIMMETIQMRKALCRNQLCDNHSKEARYGTKLLCESLTTAHDKQTSEGAESTFLVDLERQK